MRPNMLKPWSYGLLVLVMMLLQLTGCGKPRVPKTPQSEQQSGMLTKENTRVGSERLALDLGEYPLQKDARCVITPVEAPSPLEGVKMQAYSFEIDTDEEVFSVMLTMPYDDAALNGQSAKGRVFAAFYNKESDNWEPVPFSIDERLKTVTVYTNHLSIYGSAVVTNENTRMAYAAYVIEEFPRIGVSSSQADEIIIASVQNGGNPGAGAVDAGLEYLGYSLSIAGASREMALHIAEALGPDALGESALLRSVNEHLGELGLLCSIAQMAQGMYDICEGKKVAVVPCYAKALKTSIDYMAGKMGAQLYSLASLGTLAIDLSLNKFGESAWEGRENIYEKAYTLYYESPGVKRDARAWAEIFMDAKKGAATPERYGLRIEGLVQRYVQEFWKDDTRVAELVAELQKHGFTSGGLNKELEADISNRYYTKLFRTVIQDAFKLMAKKETIEAERAVRKKLDDLLKKLNRTCRLQLIDTSVSEDKPVSGYKGSKVYVDLPDTVTDAKSWSTVLDSKGSGKISFTVLAYLMAGAPNKLTLYKPGTSTADPPDRTLSFVRSFTYNVPTVTVKYGSPGAEEPVSPPDAYGSSGSWSGDWTGTWSTNWGQMVLTQSGDTVTGNYTHDNGKISGKVVGNKLVGTWSESPSYSPPNDAGDFEFTMSADGKSLSGRWRYGSSGDWSSDWMGARN